MVSQPQTFLSLPDHTQLPESDGTFVKNFLEHPQSILLTDGIRPRLDALHPDGRYCIGQDSGIYWRLPQPPEPVVRGAESPDWFYIPDVPPMLEGRFRRSYVLWQELIPPFIVLEFVSGDGREERDTTPYEGKFWIYERIIRPAFYGIYDVQRADIELYELIGGRYRRIEPNQRGHYPIAPLGVELGLWQGAYLDMDVPWLRWWDESGVLMPLSMERAEAEHQRAEQERQRAEQADQRAEQERRRAEVLAEHLRSLGVDPTTL